MPREPFPCSLRRMAASELYWVAGVLEGEGCFTTMLIRGQRRLCIQVRSTDKDVCETLQIRTGVGTVNGPRIFKGRPTHQPTYMWIVQRQLDAKAMMQKVYPLMMCRRQGQIELAFQEVGHKLERM